jgi:hypothetical protein
MQRRRWAAARATDDGPVMHLAVCRFPYTPISRSGQAGIRARRLRRNVVAKNRGNVEYSTRNYVAFIRANPIVNNAIPTHTEGPSRLCSTAVFAQRLMAPPAVPADRDTSCWAAGTLYFPVVLSVLPRAHVRLFGPKRQNVADGRGQRPTQQGAMKVTRAVPGSSLRGIRGKVAASLVMLPCRDNL